MARPIMVDLRNVYRPDDMARVGFVYDGIGRPGAPGAGS
jgi:UDPglucose 6-dehydrogenase